MKKLTIMAIAALSITAVNAQDIRKTRFEVEIDPIAYALKGCSLHGIVVHNHWRGDIGVFAITQPEGYTGNKGFEVYTKGAGIKLNRLLNKKETWFAGIGCGYGISDIKHTESRQQLDEHIVSIGIHTGYRFFFFKNTAFKNLYITPWFSVDYNIPIKEPNFKGYNYESNSFSIFPTVHIGYTF